MTGVTARLRLLAEALGGDLPVGIGSLPDVIADRAGEPDHEVSYLVLAVVSASIPDPSLITGFTREWHLSGLAPLVRRLASRERLRRQPSMPVRIVGGTVVDVTDTLASTFITGIQRVARETVSRWWADADRDVQLVRWDARARRLLALSGDRIARLVADPGDAAATAVESIVIPYRASFLLPEIAVDLSRAARLRTIARFGGGRATAIGFDCIPITSAETAGGGMPGAFSKYLSTLARFDAIAPISDAAATEYRGWRRMLSGAGLVGPDIETVTLPFATSGASDADRAAALSDQLALGGSPIVLCVGSHEPRKNHVTVLHAAELAWRQGHDFSLVLVGGNSWETETFDRLVAQLRRHDRRIVTLSGVGDDVIWDLYDLATFSVFASLNEGFGLPVVESLSHGTPVITSDFGSMRSLGEGHGARLVDPRDARALAAVMVDLLTDPVERARLAAETRTAPSTSWDSYADDLWHLARPAAE